MEKKTDEYYIREILKGDTGSFSYLVEKYSHLAFSLSLKVLGQREDAEEAAQDSFIKAYNSLVSFSGTSTFKTWIFRIVYNTAISKLRSRKSTKSTSMTSRYRTGKWLKQKTLLDNWAGKKESGF